MRLSVIRTLSSVLFLSYFRAGRGGGDRGSRAGRFIRPSIMLILDVIAFAVPFFLVQLILPYLTSVLAEHYVWQILVGLPMLLTSGVIVAGILFELGQGAGVSSSETVNWLPISPREYVAASSLSTAAAYSLLFAISAGATLPLSFEFNLLYAWSVTSVLSILALLLGALIVEILRSTLSKVSSTVYRRSSKFAIISRIVLVVLLLAMIQVAFNPYVLFYLLGAAVSIVDLTWFVPMIWPSVAIANLIRFNILATAIFSALSVAFTLGIFLVASYLRQKYWSQTPISIKLESSATYTPQTPSLLRLGGFSHMEAEIALKEFRAVARRRELASFIAIPVILVISLTLPILFSPSANFSGRSPQFFLAAMVPFITSLMLSSITIGQEGKAVVNILMLPIKANSLIKGKLLPAWIISIIASVGTALIFQMLEPMPIPALSATIAASILVVVVESFIGFGVGVRYPDFTVAARGRYITFTGFVTCMVIGGPMALAIFAPIIIHVISSGGIIGEAPPIPSVDLTVAALTTAVIGASLSYLAYRYCRSGAERFLSNLEA